MEAGNSTAGDRDEQGREQEAAVYLEAGESRQLDGGVREQDAQNRCDDHEVQQIAVQIIAGLQQNPHRGDGSHCAVYEYEYTPEEHGAPVAGQRPDDTGSHAQRQNGNATKAGHSQVGMLTVYQEAEDNGQRDEQQGSGCNRTVGSIVNNSTVRAGSYIVEGFGDDIRESGVNQQHDQPGEDAEHQLGLVRHALAHNRANGQALVAHGYEQGGEVLHSADEDAADQNPQQNGDPAEEGSLDRPVDGACAGDRREVMAQQNRSLGRTVVHAVFQFISRGFAGGVNAPLLGQPAAIENIAANQDSECNDQNDNTTHDLFLPPTFFPKNK